MFDNDRLMDRHHHQSQYNYGIKEQPTLSSAHQRSSRNGGGRKSLSPPRYSSLTPDFDIGPPPKTRTSDINSNTQRKTDSYNPYSYAPMSSEPNPSRTRKSMYSSDLPPSYESSVSPSVSSPGMNNNMMESKRREYLQQKLTHLKKQNTTSLEHFNIVRDDVRQSKELMEKQIMQAYGAMKQRLEAMLQDSLRSLQDMENDMTEPLDSKIDQLKKNMRSIDMTESILSRQPYSDSVKEKVDSCLKTNIPPFSSDIDICTLTDQNNFSLLRASTGFLTEGNGHTMKPSRGTSSNIESQPRYEKFEREKDRKYSESKYMEQREKKGNTRNIQPNYDNFDDSKSDISLNEDFDYPRGYNTKEKKHTRRSSPEYLMKEEKNNDRISDSVIGSYQQLEDLYSQTKNCAVFKGANF